MSQPLTTHTTHSTHHEDAGFSPLSEKALEANEIETARPKEQHVTPVPAKRSFGSKVKRHCARFWWLHILIFCIIFLIVALCLVYVGMPKIAQHDVNKSSLEVTELKFMDPTPNSIVLTQKAILHSPSKFTPTLDTFSAATYLVVNGVWAAAPMIYMQMPGIHAQHPKSNAVIENQKVEIVDQDQLAAYALAVLSSEEVSTGLSGKTKLHLGALPVVKVNYNTTTTYKGLNGLKGFNVTDVRIDLSAKKDTPNLKGNAFIPNPSDMTIAMGNVTLTLSTASKGEVGVATINDMTILPGDNHFPMSAIVVQSNITASMGKDGFVELLIKGKSAVYNGEHLTYYEKALASQDLRLHMNVGQVLADSYGSE